MWKRKRLKVMIISLVSLLTLGTIFAYKSRSLKAETSMTLSNNVITSEPEMPDITENGSDGSSSIEVDKINQSLLKEIVLKPEQTEESITTISLHNQNSDDNIPFQVANMFPGDQESQYFQLKVAYKNRVTVHFSSNIHLGSEKLAEVLKCKIVLPSTGEILYEGLMGEMPESLVHTMTSRTSTIDDLSYQIITYLEHHTGNEYMNQRLVADFHWWVDEVENLESLPPTGYHFPIYLGIALVCGGLFILFIKKHKKGEIK